MYASRHAVGSVSQSSSESQLGMKHVFWMGSEELGGENLARSRGLTSDKGRVKESSGTKERKLY